MGIAGIAQKAMEKHMKNTGWLADVGS